MSQHYSQGIRTYCILPASEGIVDLEFIRSWHSFMSRLMFFNTQIKRILIKKIRIIEPRVSLTTIFFFFFENGMVFRLLTRPKP